MTKSRLHIAFGTALLSMCPTDAVQADGPYDGICSGTKPSKGQCKLGKTTLTIQDNLGKGEVEKLFIDVRDDNEKERAVLALKQAAVDRITAPSRGGGTVDAVGSIIIAGTVSTDGIFEGSIAGQKFTGKFSGHRFSGAVSSRLCETKVSLRRKQ